MPGVYGAKTLDEINDEVSKRAETLGVEVTFFQSNLEGLLIDCIQENWGKVHGIIVNPGALTHYSYALKDALTDAAVPVIEVHLSNPYARERWRRRSVIADTARGQIAGFGWRSYTAALDIIAALVKEEEGK
jgi:3-dehydroquinate dehydratase-2